MLAINRGGHFLLTEAVTKNCLTKSINGGGYYKRDRLQNTPNFGGGQPIGTASVNSANP